LGDDLAMKMPELDDDLLTPREVAEIFGVRTTTIARWSREGRLNPTRTPGGHRRYSRAEVNEVLERRPEPGALDRKSAEDAVRLYGQGWSIRQVATRFDTDYGSMRRLLRRRITLRTRNSRSLPNTGGRPPQ
jgi:excisionase family DNA binding protein